MMETPRILPLAPAHAAAAHALTQQLRWPHRPEDWARFIRWANAHGLACGLFHRQQLIGTALCWHWGDTHANLGLMIIAREWQGQGLGHRLLGHMLQAHAGRTVSLMATEAGLPLYRQLGFRPLGRSTQYQGIIQSAAAETEAPTSPGIRRATPSDVDALCALDTRLRGQDRSWLLRDLIIEIGETHQPTGTPPLAPLPSASLPPACCALLSAADGTIRGYGVRRHFGRGWLIGPLAAPTGTDAIALLRWLCAPLHGGFVRVDLGWRPATTMALPAADTSAPTPPACAGQDQSTLPDTSSVDAWLRAHGLEVVDQPLAMMRPAGGADTGSPGQPTTWPATPAVVALGSQATG